MKELSKTTKKILEGEVISNKMEKTIVVSVLEKKQHPLYRKTLLTKKKYKARTEESFEIGDFVRIQECKPFSKDVKWVVIDKVIK